MAKIEDQIKALHAAADANAAAIHKAFLAVIEEIRSNLFDSAELEIAVSQLDREYSLLASSITKMDDLLFGIGMDKTAYIFHQQIQNIYMIGGGVALVNLPLDLQKAISFDTLGDRAVKFIRNYATQTIQGISQASRDGVVAALERTVVSGANPAKMVRDVRQLIGLTYEQVQAVWNFREQLETRQVLGFTPPGERRLDAIEQTLVRRHMRDGVFTQAEIDDMVERYYQRLINKRAWDIAHTESMNAINNGQLELWEQGLDQGILNDNKERKFWIVTRDDRLRATHAAIPGMNPNGVKIRSQFLTPFGLVYGPGDRNVNLINCRCVVVLGEIGQSYAQDGYIV